VETLTPIIRRMIKKMKRKIKGIILQMIVRGVQRLK